MRANETKHTPSFGRRDTLRSQMARSHGSGEVDRNALAKCGDEVVFEPGSLVFHPENVEIGDDVYVGHYAILKGYFKNKLRIGDGSWIGQLAFIHAAGGVDVGRGVGIGPSAKILTSSHAIEQSADGRRTSDDAIMKQPLTFAPVVLEGGCDIGVGAIILPGVTVGRGAQVAAGAVVTRNVAAGTVVAGVPAKPLSTQET